MKDHFQVRYFPPLEFMQRDENGMSPSLAYVEVVLIGSQRADEAGRVCFHGGVQKRKQH